MSTLEELRQRLRIDTSENQELSATHARATTLVTRYADESTPQEIIDLAVVEVAAELWAHRDAIGGIITAFSDGPTTRLARDPMAPAYPILDPYKGIVFG